MYTSRLKKILQSNKSFKGIYISDDFEDLDLSFYEKIILSQVESLSKKKGFTEVTNDYLGLLLNKSSNAASKIVSALVKNGYLEADFSKKSRRLSLKPKNFWPKEGRLQETEGRLQETEGRLQETEGRQECSHNIYNYKSSIDKYISNFEEAEMKNKNKVKSSETISSCFKKYRLAQNLACQKAAEIILAAKLPRPIGSSYKTFGRYYLSLGQQLFEKSVEATEIFATTPNLLYLEKACSTALEELKNCDFSREVALKKIENFWLRKRYSQEKGLAFEELDDYFWITKKVKAGPLDGQKAKLVQELCSKYRVRIPQLKDKGILTLTYYAEVLDEPVIKEIFRKSGNRRKCYAEIVEQLDLSVSKNIFHRKEFFEYMSAENYRNLSRAVRKKIVKEEAQKFIKERQEKNEKLPPIPLFKWSEG